MRRLWVLAPKDQALATVSVAAVPKKATQVQRKILQPVPFNEMVVPPGQLLGELCEYGLEGPAAVTQMQCGATPSCLTVDQCNAFTYVEVPEHWWPYMTGPVIEAGRLPASWMNGRFSSHQRLRPWYTRLGMGHGHAAIILLLINGAVMLRAILATARLGGLGDRVYRLNLALHRSTRVQLGVGDCAVYVHLDDFLIAAAERWKAVRLRLAITTELHALGFDTTVSDMAEGGVHTSP